MGHNIGIIPQTSPSEHIGMYVTDKDIISINQMGDGVVHIIGLISLLLTEDNKLYLIEELENDLHPEALKHLLDLIVEKATSNQFIISTHSHIVLRYLGSVTNSKIFETSVTFDKTEQNIKIGPLSVTRDVPNDPVHRMTILQKLGYEPWDFELYKGYLIVEESSAEKIIRDFLIPVFTPNLKNRIKTIAASGADDLKPRFHDFLKLFVFIHTASIFHEKAWIIADGDDAGVRNIESLKKEFKNWPSDHFLNFSAANFEDFYPDEFDQEKIEIFTEKHGKQERKKNLLNKVLRWIENNPEEAKASFKKSAKEVIDKLLEIEKKLNTF